MSHEDDDREVTAEVKEDDSIVQASSVKLALAQLRAHQGTAAPKSIKEDGRKRARTGSADRSISSTGRRASPTDFAEGTLEEQFENVSIPVELAKEVQASLNVERLFVLQVHALKQLINHPNRDACISAPTGSGKTLMYLLPVLYSLRHRVVVRTRALVLVPSRELTMQVIDVARPLCSSLGLLCACLTGDVSMQEEARRLVKSAKDDTTHSSVIDVLVSTPGRLLDHIDRTQGFTLQHLEVLVVDEADKLLSQSYHDWLDRLYRAATRTAPPRESEMSLDEDGFVLALHEQVTVRDRPDSKQCVFAHMRQSGPRLRRILCSATLTNNPQKIAALALHQPILIDANSFHELAAGEDENATSSRLSTNLSEQVYRVSTKNKPLVLLALLTRLLGSQQLGARVLVFASSVDRAQRVHSLVSHALAPQNVGCTLLSSQQSHLDRKAALQAFRDGKTRVLVASDLAARGLDIPRLEFVISYDAPKKSSTHVHRAGRTARAGMSGTSIVLLQREDVKAFAEIRSKLSLDAIEPSPLEPTAWEAFKPVLEAWREVTAGASMIDAPSHPE